ncbi:MAG: hypothetical protein H3C62_10370 [Gemmatimonadaceae bacterium]|nr:hypothetical protein [Gemmatimonadaceae bacterium]
MPPTDSVQGAGNPSVSVDSCAALIGWWFAPAGRAHISVDPFESAIATSLAMAVHQIRAGAGVAPALVDEAMNAGGFDETALPDLLDASLSVALHEQWPPLLIAADLAAGACGRTPSLAATILRAVSPVAAGLTSDAFVIAPSAPDLAGALSAIASEARGVHRLVAAYREACLQVEDACREFGRAAFTAAALARALGRRPALMVAEAAAMLHCSAPTAGAAVDRLVESGALREITGRGRDRVFVYAPAVALAG